MGKNSSRRSKNKVLTDIVHNSVFPKKIYLNKEKFFVIHLSKIIKYSIISFFAMTFIFGSVYAPVSKFSLQAASNNNEQAQLETKLAKLEGEIAIYEKQAENYKNKGYALESEVRTINAKIAKLNLQIKDVILNLKEISGHISTTKEKIKQTQQDISNKKTMLTKLIQNLYESENKGIIEIMIENPRLSDFFFNINSLMAVQDEVRITVAKMIKLRDSFISQKERLAFEYEDTSKLKKYQESQKYKMDKLKNNKKILLSNTKQAEKVVTELVKKKKQTASEIRSRIFKLIGGGELSFGDAYRLAKFASEATGIKPSLILAVLDNESSLGKNVGKCEYNKNPYYPSRAKNRTTMNPVRDIPIFLSLLKDLKNNGIAVPNPPLVSCPIPRDGAYGGAMGPAQFLPSTWNLYKNKIISISGDKHPSPWNNSDAFIATAAYLKDAYNSRSCVKYAKEYSRYDSVMLRSRCAAAKYYAGSRWWNYRWLYGESILQRARKFENDIKILNS